MQPRVEVDAVNVAIPLPDLLQHMAMLHHSRYPVYEEHIDNVIGLLNVKDVFDLLIRKPALLADPNASFDLRKLLRAPLYVPETLAVDKLLDEMRRQKTHLAIVIDEYGGMAGLATMEDILEELVGEVSDEFDVEPRDAVEDANLYLLDGLTSMTDVIERFGDPNPGGEIELSVDWRLRRRAAGTHPGGRRHTPICQVRAHGRGDGRDASRAGALYPDGRQH